MAYTRIGLRAFDYERYIKAPIPVPRPIIPAHPVFVNSLRSIRHGLRTSFNSQKRTPSAFSIADPILAVALRRFDILKGVLAEEKPCSEKHLRIAQLVAQHVLKDSRPAMIPEVESDSAENSIQNASDERIVWGLDSDSDDSSTPPSSHDDTEVKEDPESLTWVENSSPSRIFYPPVDDPDIRPTRNQVNGVNPLANMNPRRIMEMLHRHLPSLRKFEVHPDLFEFGSSSSGTFNVVQFVSVLGGPDMGTYVVKVPRSARRQDWSEEDGLMLQSEAETIHIIFNKTKCPVAEVMGYNRTNNNVLGLPYILQRAAKGVPAHQLWFVTDNKGGYFSKSQLRKQDAMALEIKRQKFLKSLARAMSELKVIYFPRTGVVIIMTTDDGESFDTQSCNVYIWFNTANKLRFMQAYPTVRDSRDYWTQEAGEVYPLKTPADVGKRAIFDIILDSPTFKNACRVPQNSGVESYVLRHEDLDLQNILCDPETGEVTCIIDWDGCRMVPRNIGYASLPLFLIKDWFPNHKIDPLMSMTEIQEYRAFYAKEMAEAIGDYNNDARFTLKSAMFQAFNSSLYGTGLGMANSNNIIEKIFGESEVLRRVDLDGLYDALGYEVIENSNLDGPYATEVRREIEKIMAC
ncbi:unnamed protein product [Periconia digitata]|uniref:Aminoglycoside phosphotransferase domain-containing protein n=1 Tax=Periconia digitata TaxID=1303443 RepID=A0A9W4UP26_9PLEO|nr:unnamed protein product [Periconia digitata]